MPRFHTQIPLIATPFRELQLEKLDATAAPAVGTPQRPFWLMRMLSRTILTGGYLTQSLYVPQDVWFQKGAKFPALAAKIAALEVVNDAFMDLSRVDPLENMADVIKELDTVCSSLLSSHDTLSRQITAIKAPSTKKEDASRYSKWSNRVSNLKQAVSRITTGNKEDEEFQYVQMMLMGLQNCLFLESWLTLCKNNTAVMERITYITQWFDQVFLVFVMGDLARLLERYQKTQREAFTHIFAEVK